MAKAKKQKSEDITEEDIMRAFDELEKEGVFERMLAKKKPKKSKKKK